MAAGGLIVLAAGMMFVFIGFFSAVVDGLLVLAGLIFVVFGLFAYTLAWAVSGPNVDRDEGNLLLPSGLSACTDYYNTVSGITGAVGVGLGIAAVGSSATVVGGLGFGGLALVAGGVSAGTYLVGLATCSIVDN